MNSFVKQFENACFEARGARLVRRRRESDRYRKQEEALTSLFHEIETKLGGDAALAFRLEALQNELGSMDEAFVYQQGFRDCLALLRWMDAFSL